MRIYRCGIIDYPGLFLPFSFDNLQFIQILEGQIYSIDLHPSGKYIATCGNDGKGNGLVTIWNTSLFDIDSSTNKRNLFVYIDLC
jgi:WD40 repeat protein